VPILRSTSSSTPNSSEAPVHDHQHAASVARGALEHLLELVEAVVAEGAQARTRELAAVQDRGVVAGVGDHGVGGAEDPGETAHVRLVAGREDQRGLGPEPARDLLLQLEVERDRAVHQPGAGERGAVALERLARGGLHPRVTREAEVVVGTEHQALAALHRHDRTGLGLDLAKVRDQALALGELEQLPALVIAGLEEEIFRCLRW
jgi:hypothetical protein